MIRDSGKKSKTELVSEFTPASIHTLYVFGVPLSSLLYERKGELLPPKGIMCHAREGVA